MPVKKKNLSEVEIKANPKISRLRIAIVISDWNAEITSKLLSGAMTTLTKAGIKKEDITIYHVPGSFELPLGAKLIMHARKYDAVICLGCVIQGETRHFDFICSAVSNGIMQLGLEYRTPVIFGVLTTDTIAQAKERSGGKHGNKGIEAAATAIQMALLHQEV